ncbi:DEKNAAC104630 [Brettanomyces naardenensis]|uniref:DEKNAAC104630 n=1 Tax=Brettanomyces naardenensis TaxID=13370 RepID=A0A448YRB0_BRENA|nr:DEKNAAC104630 [Brettanomyces naardenensis]
MDTFTAVSELVRLAARDDDSDMCVDTNDFNGEHMGARISSVFVILITSAFGAFFPLLSSRYSFIRLPKVCFFLAKYFGSGVIVATAFIHLLQPANENLSVDCLGAPFTEYPMAFGICMIMLFVMFFMELVAYRWIETRTDEGKGDSTHTHSAFGDESVFVRSGAPEDEKKALQDATDLEATAEGSEEGGLAKDQQWDADHYGHERTHQDPEVIGTTKENKAKEGYAGNLLNVFILEFGIIFHSIFIGLTLACSGDEFVSLYIVLVFHQMFEGLGLGTRIALVDWPKSRRFTPWMLSLAYALTTPVSIAIGLGVRNTYPPNSRRALIVNGCFDSVSAGILIYTGMIELMAHEFLFSDEFKGRKGFKNMMWAYFVMCVGAGLMCLLGKWA